MFKITNKWLDDNRTKKGGWTKAQAEILYLKWPFKKSWKKSIIGFEISKVKKLAFELASTRLIEEQTREVLGVDVCVRYLCKNMRKVSDEQMIKLNDIWIKADI